MTLYTPQQGFPFPTLGDQPCQLAPQVANLAQLVDAKGAQLDSDLARLKANNMVKISVSNWSPTTGFAFTTVEYNRGTPTDLTLYSNGLRLNGGLWVIGVAVQFTPTSANNSTNIRSSAPLGGPGMGAFERDYGSDPGFFNQTINGVAVTYGQNVSVCELYYVTQPLTQIACGLSSFSDPFFYATMWGFQVGDL